MARAIWSGFLSFGLVNVPVGLYSATVDESVHFNLIHKGTSHPIRYKKVDAVTGAEVDNGDIVSGYPMGDGEYVVVSREELKQAAAGRSETIEITDFVDLGEVDPMYFRQSYYLAPRGKVAGRAYALLRQAMSATSKIGVAKLVLRDKEHLVAVRPGERVLVLETMYFSEEIRQPSEEVGDLSDESEARPRELEVAKQLIEGLTTQWSPERYENSYRDRVMELIEEKRKGHEVVFEDERPRHNVIDLMSALEASVARSGGRSGDGAARDQRTRSSRRRRVDDGLEAATKSELVAQAAELDIAGRSRMTKPELVEALRKTEAFGSRRRVS